MDFKRRKVGHFFERDERGNEKKKREKKEERKADSLLRGDNFES